MPLQPPARALVAIAIGRVVDMPHNKLENMVQVRPIKIAGFRPNLSDALPHITAVRHCEREKTADVMPAHFATFSLSIPKLSIISGYVHVNRLHQARRKWTDEVGKDRSHGDRFRKSAYCFVFISRCSRYNKSQEAMQENMRLWSSTDADLCSPRKGEAKFVRPGIITRHFIT